jgi:hypothetical protein
MLTPQQEKDLRNYGASKGYNPAQVESFIQAKKSPVKQAQPKKEGDGFLKSLVKEPIKTLLVKPAVRVAQAGIAGYGAIAKDDRALDFSTKDITIDTPFGKYTVEGQKTGMAGIKQIGGDTVRAGAELFGGKIANAGLKTAVKLIGKGTSTAINQGSKLIGNAPKVIGDAAESFISTVDDTTKTVLNPTRLIPQEARERLIKKGEDFVERQVIKKEKFDRYLKQAQKAVSDPSQPSPLELAGKRAEEALNILRQKLSKQGSLKSGVIDTVGSRKIGGLTQIRQNLQKTLTEKIGASVTDDGIKNARGRISKISLDPADNKLIRDIYRKLGELKFSDSIQKADDMVDAIQDLLYKRQKNVAIPVNSQVEAILKQSIGELNKMVKKAAGGTYRKSNLKYSNFKGLFDDLNKALGKDANKGGSLMKRVFSPTDGGTKQLFAQIKKATGIDLVEEAALAKHVMEIVGDPRGNNLLELLKETGVPTPTNLVTGTGKFLLNKVRDPIKESARLIEEGKLRP